jgi:hypothetical protein
VVLLGYSLSRLEGSSSLGVDWVRLVELLAEQLALLVQ